MLYSSYSHGGLANGFQTDSAADISYLTSSVDNLSGVFLALIFDDFAKRVFDRGVIALYKVAIHELNSERGFS